MEGVLGPFDWNLQHQLLLLRGCNVQKVETILASAQVVKEVHEHKAFIAQESYLLLANLTAN